MWPGFQSQTVDPICELNLLLGSLPCSERFFSGYSGFPLSLKTNTSKFQLDQERKDTFQRVLILSVPWVKQIAISNYWSSQWNNYQLALIWISNKANKSTVFRLFLQNKMFQLFMFPSDVLTLLPKFELNRFWKSRYSRFVSFCNCDKDHVYLTISARSYWFKISEVSQTRICKLDFPIQHSRTTGCFKSSFRFFIRLDFTNYLKKTFCKI